MCVIYKQINHSFHFPSLVTYWSFFLITVHEAKRTQNRKGRLLHAKEISNENERYLNNLAMKQNQHSET